MAGTPVFTIEPNPHWVIIDNFSKLPNNAVIYTYSSLNPSQFKPAFQDPFGQIPFGQPIQGFGNGTMPPIYWEFDPNNPTDTYYIRVYDNSDPNNQIFLWDFNGLSGGSAGGGGTVTASFDIENLVINGTFFRNVGNQATLPTSITLAPSNNAGYANDTANTNVVNNGPVGPDIVFAKNNTSATDSISFVDFTPNGVQALTGDVTPQFYMNYNCTGPGSGETYKYTQFPIVQGVRNLSGQACTIKIWAKSSTSSNITLSWRQFYGSGGAPTADQIVPIGTIALGTGWSVTIFNTTTPSVTGATIGSCGNDALFLQVNYPLSPLTGSVDIIKPSIYLGTFPTAPGVDFHSNDMIDSIINTPRTGDIRTTLNNFMPGWVQMNDGTIGDASSGGSARANVDTFPLFSLIWNLFNGSPALQALAPMYSANSVSTPGTSISYGANAAADFAAHNQLSLTRNLGRVMAGALPVSVSQSFTSAANVLTVTSTASFFTGVPVVLSGGSLPAGLVAGTTYYAIQLSTTTLSLATTVTNAIAGTPVITFGAGSGTITVPDNALGTFLGEELHTLVVGEMPLHHHTIPGSNIGTGFGGGGSAGYQNFVGSTTDTSSVGGGASHNTMQPTVFMNVFIKL